MFTFKQPVSREIFEKKYMLHNEESPEVVFSGIAREIAMAEKPEKRKEIETLFYRHLSEGKIIPAGRILANARPESPMKNYNNCFTIDVEDSMEGIYDSLKEDAMISKMGGGVGFDISKLRPKGDSLSRGGESSGIISFLRIFDQSAKTIMTGGQRRSAHIALLDISHPDVEEFIAIKQGDSNMELTQFNISIKITDKFIEAVEKDSDWNLEFDGRVYKTIKARELYDKLAHNAFMHNEPGIFNADRVEQYNNGYWAFRMDRVNPCGELVMPAYSLCCLSAVNLGKFIVNPFEDNAYFHFDAFAESVGAAVRFLDNVLDRTAYPLEKIEVFSKQWRRIGLGFTALGDALAMLKLPYDSDKAIEFGGKMAKALRDASYTASAELATEKGAFPACDIDRLLEANFIRKLNPETREKIKQNGLRNIQLNTVAPTGTTSLTVGNNCSSGIEPIFALQYDRNIRTGKGDETVRETICDDAWLIYREKYPEADINHLPDYFRTTLNIDPYKAVDMQGIIQEYIDHSISKTLNLPPGTSFEEYKNLYLYAYHKGLKGFTTFNPEGSMKGILEYNEKTAEKSVPRMHAPKRPTELKGEAHFFKHNGHGSLILSGFLEGSLFEIFCLEVSTETGMAIDTRKQVRIVKEASSHYNLSYFDLDGNEKVLEDITKQYDSANSSLARFISMSLRHGTALQFIIEQLNKDTQFANFERVISRVLKKYIKNGEEVVAGEKNCVECNGQLVFKDGCVVCPECGWSKCS